MSGAAKRTSAPVETHRRVAVVGGGLAGLAAAVRLTQRGIGVDVYESRRRLGGRAGSFLDPETETWVDHCQHIGMGCCDRLIALAETVGEGDFFRRDRTLHFVGTDGRITHFTGSRWLPAPLHLAGAFWRWPDLSWTAKLRLAGAVARLVTLADTAELEAELAESWLKRHGEDEASIASFWSVIAVSALSESLDHVSTSALRKVMRDGFLRSRDAYHVLVPRRPIGEWSESIAGWLTARGGRVFAGAHVEEIVGDSRGVDWLRIRNWRGVTEDTAYERVIVAIPWHQMASLYLAPMRNALPRLKDLERFSSGAIASVHLWWDRPLTTLPHVAFIGRLCQWMFRHEFEQSPAGESRHHYQVVVSASHRSAERSRESIANAVVEELRQIWPAAREARLVHQRTLVQPQAVFSPTPGLEKFRPEPRTPVPGLFWAGDWTRTGWPATMEGAIRSGENAAEALVESLESE